MKTVGHKTSVCKASKALSTILRLYAVSRSIGSIGFPTGAVNPPPKTIRFAPTLSDMDVNAFICTLGIPTRSNSLQIVAPQRVQVPHVLVKITAPTPSSLIFFAQALPMDSLTATFVPTPHVVPK